MAPSDTPWLTKAEAAERMRCSTRSLHRIIASGDLPTFKRRRLVRLRVEDVDAYIEAGRTGQAIEAAREPSGEVA